MGIGGHIELGPPLLDPAQRHVFYRVIADRVQMQCIAHGAMDRGQGKGLDKTQDLHVFSLAGRTAVLRAEPCFQQPAQRGELGR